MCILLHSRQPGKKHTQGFPTAPLIMINFWSITIDFLYPIPLLSLLLLTIPLPNYIKNNVRHQVMRFLDAAIFCKLCKGLTVYDLAIGFSVILFFMTGLESYHNNVEDSNLPSHIYEDSEGVTRDEILKTLIRCNLWREERNFLISTLSLVLWLVLYRIRILMKENECQIVKIMKRK